jgi:hypothetical protein
MSFISNMVETDRGVPEHMKNKIFYIKTLDKSMHMLIVEESGHHHRLPMKEDINKIFNLYKSLPFLNDYTFKTI